MRGAGLLAASLAVWLSTSYGAQTPASFSALRGTVIEASTGRPLANATVLGPVPVNSNVSRAQVRPTRPTTTTNSEGRFLLEGLGSGRLQIAFEKDGYLSTTLPFAIKPGDLADAGIISLPRTGVISGRVFRSDGSPAVYVRIVLYYYRMSSGRLQLVELEGGISNDRGEYRLPGLRPNRYWLGFQPDLSRSNVKRPLRERWSMPDPTENGVVPLLYPGVGDLASADAIEIDGNEVQLTDVVLGAARLGSVRVHLIAPSDDMPEEVEISVRHATPSISRDYMAEGSEAVGMNPEFVAIRMNLDSPRKVLTYWIPTIGVFNVRVESMSRTGERLLSSKLFEFLGKDLDVEANLVKAEGTLDIQIFLEDGGGLIPLSGVRPGICNARPLMCATILADRTDGAGKTTLRSMVPSTYNLQDLVNLPPDLYLSSATQGERDVLLEGILVNKESSPLTIRLKSGLSMIEGTVLDSNRRVVRNALVSLVPDPPLDDTYFLSFRCTTRSDQEGRFVLNGVTPGSYHIYSRVTSGIPILDPPHVILREGVPLRLQEKERREVTLIPLDSTR